MSQGWSKVTVPCARMAVALASSRPAVTRRTVAYLVFIIIRSAVCFHSLWVRYPEACFGFIWFCEIILQNASELAPRFFTYRQLYGGFYRNQSEPAFPRGSR